jgi:hypothetical protein
MLFKTKQKKIEKTKKSSKNRETFLENFKNSKIKHQDSVIFRKIIINKFYTKNVNFTSS